MSISSRPVDLPEHWEVALDADPVPPELGDPFRGWLAPRYRCGLDGTRLWTRADVDAHDRHFHRTWAVGAGEQQPGDAPEEAHDALDLVWSVVVDGGDPAAVEMKVESVLAQLPIEDGRALLTVATFLSLAASRDLARRGWLQ